MSYKKILLHACCAICSGDSIRQLKEQGYIPIVYFNNPNLDTIDEFDRRLYAQKKVCEYWNVELITEEYNPDEYLNAVVGYENEPERGARCDICFDLRLRKTVQKAKELGINYVTTSLVISPHKNFQKLSKIGSDIAREVGNVEYVVIDFKKKDGFLKTNLLSKELGLYRQNYCGCKFSKN